MLLGHILLLWSIIVYPVSHNFEPCKNGWTQWDAVWVVESGGPMGSDHPCEGQFWGGNVICMANDWLKEQNQQFFYNGIRALEKRWTKCISVAGNCAEKWQNIMYISCDYLCQSTKFMNAHHTKQIHKSESGIQTFTWTFLWVTLETLEHSVDFSNRKNSKFSPRDPLSILKLQHHFS